MTNASSTSAPSDQWVQAHYGRIYRAAWVMTGDAWEAEDLAQETFVVALDRWERFEGRSSESTWLFGILVRLRRRRARTLARLQRRLQQYWQIQPERAESADPQSDFYRQQWRESVWADVATLPADQRDAVTLRYAQGLSYQQIASALGCAIGTAKTRVHHGIGRLRRRHGWDAILDEAPDGTVPCVRPRKTHPSIPRPSACPERSCPVK